MSAALHAEWTKLRTTAGPAWLLLAAAALTAALSTLAVAVLHCPAGGCQADVTKVSLTGVQLGQAVVAVLAVLVIGTEYSTGMIRTTLAALPRRTTVLAAKAVVVTVAVLPAAAVGVATSLLAGQLLLPGTGYPSLSPTAGPTLRAGAGSVLYLALIALLSLGIATLTRDSATAIGLVLALLYLFPILLQAVNDPGWRRHIQQLAPGSAGLAVQATTGLDTLPIGPWAGLGVLAAWAGAALLLAAVALNRRDA
jgi:ABC-2 type transport system permease protein